MAVMTGDIRWRIVMSSENQALTREQREEFWTTVGWSPQLSEQERRKIEAFWDDDQIREMTGRGF